MESYKILTEYPRYCIFTDGSIWNISGKIPKEICGYIDKKEGYKRYHLCDKNGKSKKIRLHQLLALSFIPNPNKLSYIDHIDGNGLNNSLLNLRWVTHTQNSRNRQVYQINENIPQSGFKFVNWHIRKNKWQGNINIKGKYKYIGVDEESERLYIKCLKKLYELTSDYDLQFETNTVKDDLIKYRIDERYIQY